MKIIKVDKCIRCPYSRLGCYKDRTFIACSYCDKEIDSIRGFATWDQFEDSDIPEFCELSDEWDEYNRHYERIN